MEYFTQILAVLTYSFVVVVGTAILIVVTLFMIDLRQTQHAIRRNFPVIGRLRYVFERLGEFFRQYFFAMDREELPFNRAERSWVYRAAKGEDSTVAFGSTRDLRPVGTALFLNCGFPTLHEDGASSGEITIGPYAKRPYLCNSLFNISGMSYGAISQPAVIALSNGAKMAGCWLNTGEGGLSEYHLQSGADLVFQIGTAKYGVRDSQGRLCDYRLAEIAGHDQIKMFEIKLSQGAKPGKGGILPACKVTDEIARIRGIHAGEISISPNRHIDIACESDLLDVIGHIREVTGKPVGLKAVIGAWAWLDRLFEEIHCRGIHSAPDFITVNGADGGTGAAPMPLIDNVGLPLRESLPLVIDKLIEFGLRDRVKVIASAKLVTPAEVAWAI